VGFWWRPAEKAVPNSVKETSKSVARRLRDPNFISRYFRGNGIDIGGGPDPLALYRETFVGMGQVPVWDLPQGDAQMMAGVADESFDFVHSSHCLEHLHDPTQGLANWFRILKPGGHLILLVPDEDLYEQGVFPSSWNSDHKWTFTLHKQKSWSPRSLNLLDMLCGLGPAADIAKVERLDAHHRYGLPRFDQTTTPIGESAIEAVVRKRPQSEIQAGGRLPESDAVLTPDDIYLLTGFRIG
jgi:SAM-dependent methyltransferase